MKRILAFCPREWRDPKAGFVEHYVHEVLRRLAEQGHYVVWVCHNYRALARRPKRLLPLEMADGIQMARLGARVLYRPMARMFLTRLRDRANTLAPFDVVLDCITHRPLDIASKTETPVIPLVFGMDARIRADANPPGPAIAVSDKVRDTLLRSGLGRNFIVTAPYGASEEVETARTETPLLVVAGNGRRVLSGAVARFQGEVGGLAVRLLNARDWAAGIGPAGLAGAWMGYCAPGAEYLALEMGAAGLPVVCAATEAAREYIEDGVTGLLAAEKSAALAAAFHRAATDEEWRERSVTRARLRAKTQSWNTTASLVLATIENLRKPEIMTERRRELTPVQ